MVRRLLLTLTLTFAFFSPVFAQDAQQNPLMSTLIMLVPLALIFYFFIIRPQNKRVKEHRSLIDSVKPGSEVMLNSGIIGRVKQMGDNYMEVEIANNIAIKVQRQSVAALLPNGTFKGEL